MPHSGDLEARAIAAFTERFGVSPTVLGRAPGRVELLGNHTDYNGGLVMAAAVNRFTAVAGRPISDQACRVQAVNFQGETTFDLSAIEPSEPGEWPNYVKGVVWALNEAAGKPLANGFEMAIIGDVPLGAGLSSSASLQAAVASFLLHAGLVPGMAPVRDDDAARLALAKILQRSENGFVGVASGLLDQFSSLFGRAHHALYLDCKTHEHARLPLGNPGPAIVVCDTKTARRLADGMYNRRRAECERVVDYFKQLKGDSVESLREVSLDELEAHWDRLDPIGRKRARHVLTENDRVSRGAQVLKAGQLEEFGRLVSASHASSRDDFENSSEALDAMVEAAEAAPGFLGGKLSGAGWAGCTVNLVTPDQAEAFSEAVSAGYAKRQGIIPDIHICEAADGAFGRAIG